MRPSNFIHRARDRESGDYAGSVSDIHSVTSRLSQVSVSINGYISIKSTKNK